VAINSTCQYEFTSQSTTEIFVPAVSANSTVDSSDGRQCVRLDLDSTEAAGLDLWVRRSVLRWPLRIPVSFVVVVPAVLPSLRPQCHFCLHSFDTLPNNSTQASGTYELRVCTGVIGFEECQPLPRRNIIVDQCAKYELVGQTETIHTSEHSSPQQYKSVADHAVGDIGKLPTPSFQIPTAVALDGTHGFRVAHSRFP